MPIGTSNFPYITSRTFEIPLPLSHVFALWQNYANYRLLIAPRYKVQQIPSTSPTTDHLLCTDDDGGESLFDVTIKIPERKVCWQTESISNNHYTMLSFSGDAESCTLSCESHASTKANTVHVISSAKMGADNLITALQNRAISFPGGESEPLSTLPDSVFYEKFYTLASIWIEETSFHSFTSHRVLHPSFRAILSMGDRAISLIIKELAQAQNPDWLWALEPMTGADAAHDTNTTEEAINAWLAWDRER